MRIAILFFMIFLVIGCQTKRMSLGTTVELDGIPITVDYEWEFDTEETKKNGGIPVFNGKDDKGNEIKAFGLGMKSIDLLAKSQENNDVSKSNKKEESPVVKLRKIISKNLGK
jgi:hypothetical protein